jgi:hypothetical protein
VPIGELIGLELTEEQQGRIIAALEEVIELLEELKADEVYIEPFQRLLEAFESEPIDWEEVWQVFIDYFTGADLWKTEDGIIWEPVTLNGFDNPDNYGFRNMVGVNPLFVGTANPFAGLEIWAAPLPSVPVGGIIVPVNRLELLAPWLGLAALAALAALTFVLVRRRKA